MSISDECDNAIGKLSSCVLYLTNICVFASHMHIIYINDKWEIMNNK